MPGKPERVLPLMQKSFTPWRRLEQLQNIPNAHRTKRELRRHRTSNLHRSISPTTNSSSGPAHLKSLRKLHGGSSRRNVGTAEEMGFQSEHGGSHSASNEKLINLQFRLSGRGRESCRGCRQCHHGMHFPWTLPPRGVHTPARKGVPSGRLHRARTPDGFQRARKGSNRGSSRPVLSTRTTASTEFGKKWSFETLVKVTVRRRA